MKRLIPRSLFIRILSPSPIPLPPHHFSLVLLHSGASDEAHRWRPESFSPSPSSSSSHSFSSSSSSPRRHHEEDSRNVKVSVWWDFENCNIPAGVNVFCVANRITSALRLAGIRGPVAITAFGDVAQLSRATQEALTSSGVCLTHVPHSGKNSSDRFFMSDLVYWVSQNPPPVHFFLISGDRDFANILHRLRMSNYNILLASTDTASGALCSAATIMWPWSALVKGENLFVKHFNHPPDGLYGSWYGHYKGVLDDPFSYMEQAANSQPDESMESISEIKPRPIPKAVVNGIRQVLKWYPEGINLSELRVELRRNNIIMDKDFFGHKKFSHLLSSMPNIVRFIPPPSGEGQPLVIGIRRRATESVEPSPKPAKDIEISDGGKGHAISQNGKPSEVAHPTTISELSPSRKETDVNASIGTSTVPQGHEAAVEVGPFERLWKTFTGSDPPKAELSPKGTDVDTVVGSSTSQQQNEAADDEGIFRRIWRTLSGPRGSHSNVKNGTISEANFATHDFGKDLASVHSCKHSEKAKSGERHARSKNAPSGLAGCRLGSLDASQSVPMDKNLRQLEEHIGAPDMRVGFFSWMTNWWKSWKSSAKGQQDGDASVKEVFGNQERHAQGESVKASTDASCQPEAHDLFSKTYFWDALESFLVTSKGSDIILKSRTRGQLVQGLQKEGPWILKDLKENHLLQLVDLLISEKKWVEESASQIFPFKPTFPTKRRCVPSQAHGSNGLSSLFSGRMSRSSLPRLPDEEKQEHISGPLESSYNESVDSKAPQNFSELKAWFQKTFSATEDVEPEDFKKLFESRFHRKLSCSSYGHLTVRSLIAACSAGDVYSQGRRKRPPSREEILSDCHRLLTELLEEYTDGFNISIFRPTFIRRYGYILDYQALGYPKLVSLLQILPGVRIESSYIFPAEKFHSDSSLEKQATSETPSDSLEGDKGEVIGNGNEDNSNGEEHVWEELGPVSDTVILEGSNHTEDVDKQVSFDEASLSDEEFTDTEDETPRHLDESEDKSRRSGEDSSLLQILDSWYSSKEGGDKEQAQGIDGLVDCSRSSADNPADIKPTDSQKLKVRPLKHYSFVSESRDDEKEKLVESILGSLRRAGDSRLRS